MLMSNAESCITSLSHDRKQNLEKNAFLQNYDDKKFFNENGRSRKKSSTEFFEEK